MALRPDVIAKLRGPVIEGSPDVGAGEVQVRIATGMAVVFKHLRLADLEAWHMRLWVVHEEPAAVANRIVEQAAAVLDLAGLGDIESAILRNVFMVGASPP